MAVFFNRATLSYNGVSLNSNTVTGEILEPLTMTKTAVNDSYSVGDSITYVVNIVNSATTAINGLTLTDNLGAYTVGTTAVAPLTYRDGSLLYYVNGATATGPTATTGTNLVIGGINIPASSNATIIYEANANNFAPLATGATITNTATLTGGGLVTPLTDTAVVTAAATPDLSIAKAVTPDTVTDNGELTYTFVVQNTGNTAIVAGDNVVITDRFDPILDNITVRYNGADWTEGVNYTYDQTTGVFATIPGQLLLDGATYTQDPVTGAVTTSPGVGVLTVSGTV